MQALCLLLGEPRVPSLSWRRCKLCLVHQGISLTELRGPALHSGWQSTIGSAYCQIPTAACMRRGLSTNLLTGDVGIRNCIQQR